MEYPRRCPARWLSDPNFDMYDFMCPFIDIHSNYYRPWKWYNQSVSKQFSSTIENEKGNYKITLDVQNFRSNEINVKVANDEIIVEAKHEERPDTHGFVTRQFRRRYPLPSQCPADKVSSMLSSDGILTIIAEKVSSMSTEKIIPIKMCAASSRRTQIESSKINSEISQKSQEEIMKNTENMMSKSKNQVMLKEDHSRLLKPEFLKETIAETNGSCVGKVAAKATIETMRTPEKTDSLGIGSTSSKIEESIEKSILGLTALTEQLGQSSLASTSEVRDMKTTADTCGMKSGSEACEMKVTTEKCDLKCAPGICDMKSSTEKCGLKGASETCDIKSTMEKCTMKSTPLISDAEMCGTKIASETCAMKGTAEVSGVKAASEMKGMSKTVIEESSSSYKSSSMMSSSTRISGKSGESVSDMISAELREAAENV